VKPLMEAQRTVLAGMEVFPSTVKPLADCLGLVLAEDVLAPHPVPPFANSAMDGYAVRAEDVSSTPVTLRVLEDVPAGSVAGSAVESGTAIKIMTGAPIPAGADAIVIVEDTRTDQSDEVVVLASAEIGDHIRGAGGDIEVGSTVLQMGTRLSPMHLGLLASVGMAGPTVTKRPTVAVFSTGDELVPADAAGLRPGAIHDSNRPMLIGAVAELGADILDLGIVPDDARLLRSVLGEAATNADAVVTSGGVSMGEYDLVKKVLSDLGRVEFWQVAMQPAKPFAFGFIGDTPLFGLPGNPVSGMVAFEQFVRPALLRRMGASRLFRRRSSAVLTTAVSTHPEKTVFVRVRTAMEAQAMTATPSGGQGSNILSALAAADAFAVVPVGVGDLAAGATVELEWFRSPETRTYEEALGG
jgi:molybdopterin molybdotransferase